MRSMTMTRNMMTRKMKTSMKMKTTVQKCGRLVIGFIGAILTVGLAGCGNPGTSTTTTLSSSTPSPSSVGQAVKLKAAVSPMFTSLPFLQQPTVTLMDTSTFPATVLDTEPLGFVLGNGTAQFSILGLLPGTHILTATFNGYDGFGENYLPSTSDPLTQIVESLGTLATTTTLTASPKPSADGQSVTLTAAVSPVGPTLATPTGSVTFEVGSTLLGTAPLTNGTATLTTSALRVGSDTLTAYYTGDSSFAGSNGSVVQTVNPVTQTTLTSNFNPSFPGQSVTFTAAVTEANSPTPPTGTVQFAIDGASVGGPVTLDGNGQATDTEAGLTLGAHTITAVYAPTGIFPGNAGTTLVQNVYPHINPQYVSPSGSDSNDGSQASPKQTIQAAVNSAFSGDTVIVEDGTYSGAGNRDIDFGGRNLTVTSRNGPAAAIIDCGGSRTSTHRGFYFHGGETNAVVSGLTVQHGYENLAGYGGAVWILSGSTVTLTNCIFTGNTAMRGGGVNNDGTLTLTGCTFTDNGASDAGGGLRNDNAAAVTGCTFSGNTSTYGGGVYNLYSGTLTLTNCALTANSARGLGGGMDNGGAAVLTNCTFTGNAADSLGGGLNAGLPATLVNCIFWGDTCPKQPEINGGVTATDCDIQGGDVQDGFVGRGILDADPLFVNGSSPYDLHLQRGSPCLGAGTHIGAPATDKDGRRRPNPPSIGAYDTATVSPVHLLWTKKDGTAAVWTIAADGSVTSTPALGPMAGWTANTIADGSDGLTRLLWTRSDGQNAVWIVNTADNSITSTPGYGPYDGGHWNVASLAVGQDNRTRLLWKHSPDGQSSVWTLDSAGSVASTPGYGPYGSSYGSWTAGALAVGDDGLSRLLWEDGTGPFAVWTLDGFGGITSTPAFGPAGWTANAIASGPDRDTRLLLNRADGAMAVWMVDGVGSVTSTPLYGPILGWACHGLTVGPDALSRVLWSRSDGASAVWTVNMDGSISSTPLYGPVPGWNAIAVSAGP